jgi:hypothetical protein
MAELPPYIFNNPLHRSLRLIFHKIPFVHHHNGCPALLCGQLRYPAQEHC